MGSTSVLASKLRRIGAATGIAACFLYLQDAVGAYEIEAPRLLSPVAHRGEAAQGDLVLLRARDGFVRARPQLIKQARGLAKSLGARLPSSSAEAFPRRVRGRDRRGLLRGSGFHLEP